MSIYEYRVVPAPKQPARVKGLRDPEARFGHGLEAALNAEGRQGWEFQRIETIPAELKRGWLSRARTESVTVMVFRRPAEFARQVEPAAMIEDGGVAPARAPSARRGAEPVLRPMGGVARE